MTAWNTVADDATIEKTIAALGANGITAFVVANGAEAKQKAVEIIPENAEVMNMTSVTLDTIGFAEDITKSGRYNAVRDKLYAMDRKTEDVAMRKMGAAPEWVVGSVHAVTEDGHVVVASATGSQLPAYAYGSAHVLWIVGGQKLVKNLDDAMKRLTEYIFPLENARAQKAYGMGSGINKLFILNKEAQPGRITMIIVKENLGF